MKHNPPFKLPPQTKSEAIKVIEWCWREIDEYKAMVKILEKEFLKNKK